LFSHLNTMHEKLRRAVWGVTLPRTKAKLSASKPRVFFEKTNGFNIIFHAGITALASTMELMRTVLRGLAAAFFVVAGTFHFLKPEMYLQIMPPYFPAPQLLVAVSGVAEIAGGIGLLIHPLRRAAAWGLIALLIAVFPANIYMLQHPGQFHFAPWILWARLPLQAVFIAWVWFAAIRCPSRDRNI
jgi:uncharacterized membrane protein